MNMIDSDRPKKEFYEIRIKGHLAPSWAESFEGNRIEMGDTEVGIITAGMPYNYAKDVFPGYSYLKLGLVHPLTHEAMAWEAPLPPDFTALLAALRAAKADR